MAGSLPPGSPRRRPSWLAISSLACCALGTWLRIDYALVHHHLRHRASSDALQYLERAQELLQRGALPNLPATIWPPGTSALWAALSALDPSQQLSAAWNTAASLAVMPLTAAIAGLLAGPRAAWIALALAALHPGFIHYAGFALAEQPFQLATAIALYLTLSALVRLEAEPLQLVRRTVARVASATTAASAPSAAPVVASSEAAVTPAAATEPTRIDPVPTEQYIAAEVVTENESRTGRKGGLAPPSPGGGSAQGKWFGRFRAPSEPPPSGAFSAARRGFIGRGSADEASAAPRRSAFADRGRREVFGRASDAQAAGGAAAVSRGDANTRPGKPIETRDDERRTAASPAGRDAAHSGKASSSNRADASARPREAWSGELDPSRPAGDLLKSEAPQPERQTAALEAELTAAGARGTRPELAAGGAPGTLNDAARGSAAANEAGTDSARSTAFGSDGPAAASGATANAATGGGGWRLHDAESGSSDVRESAGRAASGGAFGTSAANTSGEAPDSADATSRGSGPETGAGTDSARSSAFGVDSPAAASGGTGSAAAGGGWRLPEAEAGRSNAGEPTSASQSATSASGDGTPDAVAMISARSTGFGAAGSDSSADASSAAIGSTALPEGVSPAGNSPASSGEATLDRTGVLSRPAPGTRTAAHALAGTVNLWLAGAAVGCGWALAALIRPNALPVAAFGALALLVFSRHAVPSRAGWAAMGATLAAVLALGAAAHRCTATADGHFCVVSNNVAMNVALGQAGPVYGLEFRDPQHPELTTGWVPPSLLQHGYQGMGEVPATVYDSSGVYRWIGSRFTQDPIGYFIRAIGNGFDLWNLGYWPDEFGRYSERAALVLRQAWSAAVFVPALFAFFALARRMFGPGRTRPVATFVVAAIAGLTLSAALSLGESRYRIPFDGLFIALASAIYAQANDWPALGFVPAERLAARHWVFWSQGLALCVVVVLGLTHPGVNLGLLLPQRSAALPNRGQHDWAKASAFAVPRATGDAWNAPGAYIWRCAPDCGELQIRFGARRRARRVQLSVDHNDRYRLLFYRSGQLRAFVDVPPAVSVPTGLQAVAIEVPAAARAGFDTIGVQPLYGDGGYSLGHLLLEQ